MALPKSIASNITGLAVAEEATLKFLPGENGNPGTPIWYGLEPNTYADFGATFTSVAREIINPTRQRLKGSITDENVKAGFNMDITQHNITRILQGFFFADAFEKPATQPFNGTQIPITSTSAAHFLATGLGFTAAGFKAGHLVCAAGFGVAANNGLAHITVEADGDLTTDKVLIVEAAPPATARLEVCGYRCDAGDLHIAAGSGAAVNLTSTALDFTTLGLTIGEWIFIGGDAAINQFVTSATTPFPNRGYGRVSSIAAHLLVLDLTTFAVATDVDAGGLQKVDLYFGKMLANSSDPTKIKRRSYQLERTMGNDGDGTQAEYLVGTIPDQLTLNLAQASKATLDLTWVGLDIQENSGITGVKTGTRIGLLGESPFNTSHDVYMARLAVVDPTTLDPTPLFAYASDIKLVVNNGVKPNKAIGVLGGFDCVQGDFAVSGTAAAYFATVEAVTAIKNNANVGLQAIIAKANAGMVFDIPQITLGGGASKVEKDKPIMIDLTEEGTKAPSGFTMMMSVFEYLPTVAMPV